MKVCTYSRSGQSSSATSLANSQASSRGIFGRREQHTSTTKDARMQQDQLQDIATSDSITLVSGTSNKDNDRDVSCNTTQSPFGNGSSLGKTATARPNASAINHSVSMPLSGHSFRTKFHGSSHVGCIVTHIPGLSNFARETFEKFPSLNQIGQQVQQKETERIQMSLGSPRYTDNNLKSLLPARDETDRLVGMYLETFDYIYHILHVPSFQSEYQQLWLDLERANPKHIVIVLLLVSIGLCLASTNAGFYNSGDGLSRDRATKIVQSCEDWLAYQIPAHETIHDFQISFLRILVRQLNARRYKQTWPNSGKVLRTFLCAGLHKDVGTPREGMSVRDREMRARLWSAAAEFELQAAFEQGMPAMPWTEQADIGAPINAADDDLDAATEPTKSFTRSSYLSQAAQSIAFRHELNGILNDNRGGILSFEKAMKITQRIDELLERIPVWDCLESKPVYALLTLSLQQYVLALHMHQVTVSEKRCERTISHNILINTGAKVIGTLKALQDSGCNTLTLLCSDHVRAALSMCFVHATTDPGRDFVLSSFMASQGSRSIEDAIAIMQNKILRYGGDQRQLWMVVAACVFMRLRRDSSKKDELMRMAAEEFSKPFHQIRDFGSLGHNSSKHSIRDNETSGVGPEIERGMLAADESVAPFEWLATPMQDFEAWMFEDWSTDWLLAEQ